MNERNEREKQSEGHQASPHFSLKMFRIMFSTLLKSFSDITCYFDSHHIQKISRESNM